MFGVFVIISRQICSLINRFLLSKVGPIFSVRAYLDKYSTDFCTVFTNGSVES